MKRFESLESAAMSRPKVVLLSILVAVSWQAAYAFRPPSPMQFSSPWSTHRNPPFQAARRYSSLHELQMHESDCTESAPTARPRFSKTAWLKRKFLASAALLSVAFSWSPQPSRASCFAPIISGETAVMDVATGAGRSAGMSIASNALLSENRLVVAQVATLDASKEIDSDAMRVAKVKADIQLFLQDSGIRWSDAAKSTAQKESEAVEIRAEADFVAPASDIVATSNGIGTELGATLCARSAGTLNALTQHVTQCAALPQLCLETAGSAYSLLSQKTESAWVDATKPAANRDAEAEAIRAHMKADASKFFAQVVSGGANVAHSVAEGGAHAAEDAKDLLSTQLAPRVTAGGAHVAGEVAAGAEIIARAAAAGGAQVAEGATHVIATKVVPGAIFSSHYVSQLAALAGSSVADFFSAAAAAALAAAEAAATELQQAAAESASVVVTKIAPSMQESCNRAATELQQSCNRAATGAAAGIAPVASSDAVLRLQAALQEAQGLSAKAAEEVAGACEDVADLVRASPLQLWYDGACAAAVTAEDKFAAVMCVCEDRFEAAARAAGLQQRYAGLSEAEQKFVGAVALTAAAAAAGTAAGTVVARSHRPAAPAAQEEGGGGHALGGGVTLWGGATSQPSMSVRALREQIEEEAPEEKEEEKETPRLTAPLPPSVTPSPPAVSTSASGISDESLPDENVWKRQSPYRAPAIARKAAAPPTPRALTQLGPALERTAVNTAVKMPEQVVPGLDALLPPPSRAGSKEKQLIDALMASRGADLSDVERRQRLESIAELRRYEVLTPEELRRRSGLDVADRRRLEELAAIEAKRTVSKALSKCAEAAVGTIQTAAVNAASRSAAAASNAAAAAAAAAQAAIRREREKLQERALTPPSAATLRSQMTETQVEVEGEEMDSRWKQAQNNIEQLQNHDRGPRI